ncbi:MAG: hypothetical protein ACRCSN_19785 [Dermatophilaceae bacterium]
MSNTDRVSYAWSVREDRSALKYIHWALEAMICELPLDAEERVGDFIDALTEWLDEA